MIDRGGRGPLPAAATVSPADEACEIQVIEAASGQLGGGIRPSILQGRRAGLVEKRHLVLRRVFAQQAQSVWGRPLIDVGTDYGYPFFDGYLPTAAALGAIGEYAGSARHYPSSYGTAQLRAAFVAFMAAEFSVRLDAGAEVMVSTGASQVFDALSRTLAGDLVVVPQLTLSTVTSIAVGNGATIVRLGDDADGNPDLGHLRRILVRCGARRIRFVYVNSPANPTGRVLDTAYLEQLVELAGEFGVLVVHDHDSWCTVHTGRPAPSILQIPGADKVAVTIVSLSKELGLPGIRVGLVAGNRWAVNALRIHNSEFCVMVPEFCQAAAAVALTTYTDQARTADPARELVQEQISASLRVALAGWRELGWPAEALYPSRAGFKFLLAVPPGFGYDIAAEDGISGVELFDFLAVRDAGVKLSTSRSFNPDISDRLRMILMQPPGVLLALFEALAGAGVHYRMRVPRGLAEQYRQVIADLDLTNL